MTEPEQHLEELRKDDIIFFAKGYAELFGKHFGKETRKQLAEFEEERLIERYKTKYSEAFVIPETEVIEMNCLLVKLKFLLKK